jgi:predicted sulfurtransferase
MIDPMMRKSTEFPVWLDKPETKEMLRGKQVLMYCTGGVRCERASALLKQKMETEEDTKELGIKGVYQLQGGIDKYFKQYPEGGLWKGKNYVFDKRFAHAPPAVEAVGQTIKKLADEVDATKPEIKVKGETKSVAIPVSAAEEILSKCEACLKPWDMYRGKRRCPTCGVPSLICKECFEADKAGTKKLKEVRCDLCVAEDIRNKRDLRAREEKEMKQYEQKLKSKLDDNYEPPIQRKHAITRKPKPNPERITRLFLKNMCAKQMDEEKLLEFLQPARVTHIQWLTDRNTGKFYGSASIEVKTAEDAGSVLALDGSFVLGRRIRIKYQQTSSKDVWPPPNTKIADY